MWNTPAMLPPRYSKRAERSKKTKARKKYEDECSKREALGLKPHKLIIKENGQIDATCDAKPAWDETVRSLIDRYLDVSVLTWEGQNKKALDNVREKLDKDFDYSPCTLSIRTFRKVITNSLRSERFRLKNKWKNGETSCPANIQPVVWEKLVVYWEKKSTKDKADLMVNARQEVKQLGAVGRLGKDRKKAPVAEKVFIANLLHCHVVRNFFALHSFCGSVCVARIFVCFCSNLQHIKNVTLNAEELRSRQPCKTSIGMC